METENKEEVNEFNQKCCEYIKCNKAKSYGVWDYVCSWVEMLWVQTYHRYYQTSKFKQWMAAMELLEEFKKNSKLAEYLKKID